MGKRKIFTLVIIILLFQNLVVIQGANEKILLSEDYTTTIINSTDEENNKEEDISTDKEIEDGKSLPNEVVPSDSEVKIEIEDKITVGDKKALILGSDNKYLIKDSSNMNIFLSDWDTPDGYFTNQTKVEGSGIFHVKSIVAVTIRKIINTDELGEVYISAGSNITIDNSEEIATDENNQETWPAAMESRKISVNEEKGEDVILNIKSKYIGIFSEILITDNSTIDVTSGAYGLYIGASKSNSLLTFLGESTFTDSIININVKEDVLPTITDSELLDEEGKITGKIIKGSTGILSYIIDSTTSSINVTSDGHGIIYGVNIYITGNYLEGEDLIKSYINVNVVNGLGIFSQFEDDYQVYQNIGMIQLTNSDISSITENGASAISGESITSYANDNEQKNKIYAKSKLSFALLGQNLTYMQQFPSGNLQFQSTDVEAYTGEGMAISTNMISIMDTNITAVADKGIAMSVCYFNLDDSNINDTNTFNLESKGSTKRHFQVYDSIPDAAGLSTLSNTMMSGRYEINIKTEMDDPDAYGIHAVLFDEFGTAQPYGGGLRLNNSSEEKGFELNIDSANGIFSPSSMDIFSGMGVINLNTTYTGIETKYINGYGFGNTTFNIVTTEGTGIKMYEGFTSESISSNLYDVDLNIEARDYGINFTSLAENYNAYFENNNINIKTTGKDSVGFYVDVKNSETNVGYINFINSNINSSGEKHGIYMKSISGLNIESYDSENVIYSTSNAEAFRMDSGTLSILPIASGNITFHNKALLSQADLANLPAINLYDNSKLITSDKGKISIVEEYETKISKSITNEPYMGYGVDKNINDITLYNWTSDTTPLETNSSGIYVNDNISGEYSLIGERTGLSDDFVLNSNANHKVMLKADFNRYVIVFDSKGGSPVDNGFSNAGELVTKPADPIKNGYVVSHWINTLTGEEWNFDTDIMPYDELELEVVWIKSNVKFNVYYHENSNGDTVGNVPEDDKVLSSDLIIKPSKNPTRNSYNFLGWYKDSTTKKQWNFALDKMPESDINLYAKWNKSSGGSNGNNGDSGTTQEDKNEYKLTYKASGNEDAKYVSYIIVYDTKIKLKENIFKSPDNKVFYEWNTKPDGSGKGYSIEDIILVEGDIVLYAIWKDSNEQTLDKENHFSYVAGYPDKSFGANKEVTRAEVSMIFFNLIKDDNKGNTIGRGVTFDIDPSKWYAQAVTYLYDNNIIVGYPDNSFKPDKPVTRGEIAMIASKFDNLHLVNKDNKFTDVLSSHWAYEYIISAELKGWISGYEDNTFRPNNYITRGELVVFVNNVLDRHVDDSGLLSGHMKFNDISPSHFAYYDVIEASNSHLYTEDDNGTEEWTEILEK